MKIKTLVSYCTRKSYEECFNCTATKVCDRFYDKYGTPPDTDKFDYDNEKNKEI